MGILCNLAFAIPFVVVGVIASVGAAKPATPAPTVEDVHVTVLGDMAVSQWTRGEWGFSALVEVKINGVWKKILFDTGASPTVVADNVPRLANLHKMKDANGNPMSVCDADVVVLSHNHHDHTLGLVELRRRCALKNPAALKTAYVGGPEIFWPRPYPAGKPSDVGRTDANVFVAGNGVGKALDIGAEYDDVGLKGMYEAAGGKFVVAQNSQPMELADLPGVWISGAIPRTFDEKTYPGQPAMVNPATGQALTDTVPEDQALVINTSKGLVVLYGCAHAGIVNTIQYAHKFMNRPVYAMLGGAHLLAEKVGDKSTVGTLTWTAAQLAQEGVTHLLGAHCTGLEALAIVRDLLKLDSTHAMFSTVATTFDLNKGISPALGLSINKAPAGEK